MQEISVNLQPPTNAIVEEELILEGQRLSEQEFHNNYYLPYGNQEASEAYA